MNGAAPASRLMQSLRAGFQQQGSFGLTPSSAALPPQAAPVTQATVISEAITTPSVTSAAPSLQDNLDLLDQVLTEVEHAKAAATAVPSTPVASVPQMPAAPAPAPAPVAAVQPTYDPTAQVMPQVVSQATDTLNVAYGRSTAKETTAAASPVETATGLQYVEEEKVPEIPVEVESYLQRVEQHADQLPQEIVIADVAQAPLASHYAKQPVIVLPITPATEAEGASQNPSQSIRWLVEFSRKIMKMFAGKVIYRDA